MSKYTLDKYFSLIKERPDDFTGNEMEIITDRQKLTQYEKENNCDLGLIYESPYHILLKDLVSAEDRLFVYERILNRNPGNAVVMVPVYRNKFVLLKQFRHSMRDYQLCFPRGFGEPHLSILENARKEIKEELGCQVISFKPMGKVVADSGICGEKVSVCLCEITEPVLKYDYEGIKGISVINLPELISLINSEIITDGYTLSAVSLYLIKNNIDISFYSSNPSVIPCSFVKSLLT